ncbi:MAG: metal-dependent transcriptional regulator [Clostridia bacterium]|nr:metal-dependent transcriptional regulator [Clostridia bacterium]
MSLQESGEMYLETIYELTQEKGAVRSIDIANKMNYSKPSVSRAVHILEENGYISIDADGHLLLTESGKEIAERTFERHQLLTIFFTKLGVHPETAAEDACRIEHVISDETFNAIKAHAKKFI